MYDKHVVWFKLVYEFVVLYSVIQVSVEQMSKTVKNFLVEYMLSKTYPNFEVVVSHP